MRRRMGGTERKTKESETGRRGEKSTTVGSGHSAVTTMKVRMPGRAPRRLFLGSNLCLGLAFAPWVQVPRTCLHTWATHRSQFAPTLCEWCVQTVLLAMALSRHASASSASASVPTKNDHEAPSQQQKMLVPEAYRTEQCFDSIRPGLLIEQKKSRYHRYWKKGRRRSRREQWKTPKEVLEVGDDLAISHKGGQSTWRLPSLVDPFDARPEIQAISHSRPLYASLCCTHFTASLNHLEKADKALATTAFSSSTTASSCNAKSDEPADHQVAQPSSSYAPLDQQEDDPQWKSGRYDRWENRQWYHEEWESGSWGCRQDDGEGHTWPRKPADLGWMWPHTAADLGWAGRVEPQISDKMSAALDTHPVPMPATISPWPEHSADHRGQF